MGVHCFEKLYGSIIVELGTFSFICQDTSTRRQQRNLFGIRDKLSHVTSSLTLKGIRGDSVKYLSELSAYLHTISLLLNVKRTCRLSLHYLFITKRQAGNYDYQFLSCLVWIDKGIKPSSTNNEADVLITRTRADNALNIISFTKQKHQLLLSNDEKLVWKFWRVSIANISSATTMWKELLL